MDLTKEIPISFDKSLRQQIGSQDNIAIVIVNCNKLYNWHFNNRLHVLQSDVM